MLLSGQEYVDTYAATAKRQAERKTSSDEAAAVDQAEDVAADAEGAVVLEGTPEPPAQRAS
jgi:hypothetical protein